MLKIIWLWRHPQSAEYLLATMDARFETIAYLARQNHVVCIAPSDRDFIFTRSTLPVSGMFHVRGVAPDMQQPQHWFDRVLHAVKETFGADGPDVVVCEGGLVEPEWNTVHEQFPDVYRACYYGGGPLWNADAEVNPGANDWDVIFVPHAAQSRFLRENGVPRVIRAYGIPGNIFRPMALPTLYHVFSPANFAAGKRPALVAQYLEQYAPLHKPSLFLGQFDDLHVLDMTRVGGIPMNNPGPPRGQPIIGGRAPQVLMPVLYNLAEVVVCGSQEEGHPNAPFEAMACGTPAVVMGDCEWLVGDACREFVDQAAELFCGGLYVSDPTPEGIHAVVEEATRDASLGNASNVREAVLKLYPWWGMYQAIDSGLRNGIALKRAGHAIEEVCDRD